MSTTIAPTAAQGAVVTPMRAAWDKAIAMVTTFGEAHEALVADVAVSTVELGQLADAIREARTYHYDLGEIADEIDGVISALLVALGRHATTRDLIAGLANEEGQ